MANSDDLRQRSKVGGRDSALEVALGGRIRSVRIAARMSQAALGQAVGISYQQVQKYEAGKDRVAASTLMGFAAAMGVKPGVFFDDDLPAPAEPISDAGAAARAAAAFGRIRDPLVVKRMIALAKALGSDAGDEGA